MHNPEKLLLSHTIEKMIEAACRCFFFVSSFRNF
jgi:hypothetical protein